MRSNREQLKNCDQRRREENEDSLHFSLEERSLLKRPLALLISLHAVLVLQTALVNAR